MNAKIMHPTSDPATVAAHDGNPRRAIVLLIILNLLIGVRIALEVMS